MIENSQLKKSLYQKKKTDNRDFFEPCTNNETYNKKQCECAKRGTSCELSCACKICTNIKYCTCQICDENCFCLNNNRECSEICSCNNVFTGKNETDTININQIQSKTKLLNDTFMTNKKGKSKKPKICKKSDRKLCTTDMSNEIEKTKNNVVDIMCYNRNISHRTETKLSVFPSAKHGYGLYCDGFIKSGGFVITYTGEMISDKEAERRGNFYEINKCSYLFNLVNQNNDCLYSMDAFFCGNKSRYINHSRDRANLKSDVHSKGGVPYIVFFALRDIYPGEELLFDYHFSEAHKKEHGIID